MLHLPASGKFRVPALGATLNREHPLSNGLVALHLMNERAGNIHDLTGNNYTSIAVSYGNWGPSPAFTGAQGLNYSGVVWKDWANNIPLAYLGSTGQKAFLLPTGLSTKVNATKRWSICGFFVYDSNNHFIIIGPRSNPSNQINIGVGRTANKFEVTAENNAVIVTGNRTLAINTLYFYAVTYDGANVNVYINGILDISVAHVWPANPTTLNYEYGTSFAGGSPTSYSIPYIGTHWWYVRTLSAGEVMSLFLDPYQNVYQSAVRRFYRSINITLTQSVAFGLACTYAPIKKPETKHPYGLAGTYSHKTLTEAIRKFGLAGTFTAKKKAENIKPYGLAGTFTIAHAAVKHHSAAWGLAGAFSTSNVFTRIKSVLWGLAGTVTAVKKSENRKSFGLAGTYRAIKKGERLTHYGAAGAFTTASKKTRLKAVEFGLAATLTISKSIRAVKRFGLAGTFRALKHIPLKLAWGLAGKYLATSGHHQKVAFGLSGGFAAHTTQYVIVSYGLAGTYTTLSSHTQIWFSDSTGLNTVFIPIDRATSKIEIDRETSFIPIDRATSKIEIDRETSFIPINRKTIK